MIRRQTIFLTNTWQLLISFHEGKSGASSWCYQFGFEYPKIWSHSEGNHSQHGLYTQLSEIHIFGFKLITGLCQLIWTVRPGGYANTENLYIGKMASLLSGVPDYFGRNKISSGGDLSHYSSASLY